VGKSQAAKHKFSAAIKRIGLHSRHDRTPEPDIVGFVEEMKIKALRSRLRGWSRLSISCNCSTCKAVRMPLIR